MTNLEIRAGREQASQILGVVVGLGVLASFLALALWLERENLQSVWTLLVAPVGGIVAFWMAQRWGSRWDKLLAMLPGLRGLVARRQAIEEVIEELAAVVSFYDLAGRFAEGQLYRICGVLRFHDALAAKLTSVVPLAAAPRDWPRLLIDELGTRNPGWPQGFTSLLLLLYQEREGQVDRRLWSSIRDNPEALRSLAELLNQSQTLPPREDGPWSVEELIDLLRPLPLFSLKILSEELELSATVVRYLAFLRENGVSNSTWPTLREVLGLSYHPSPSPVTPADIARLLEGAGQMALKTAYPGVAEPLLLDYARLAAVLFLSRTFSHRLVQEHLCRALAQDRPAVELVWAFLDLKQDLRSENQLGGQPFLALDYLIHHWQDKVKRAKRRASFGPEIATLENALSLGNWLPRLPDLVERTQIDRLRALIRSTPKPPPPPAPPPWAPAHPSGGTPPPSVPPGAERKAVAEEAAEQLGLDKRPDLLGPLLQEVTLDALGRNAETGRFIPYLITFHAKRGPLSQLIDLLATPPKLAAEGITISNPGGERRMYNFRPYTENTRIGVVPPGYSFEEFQERFQQDLETVLDNAAKLVPPSGGRAGGFQGLEVMLHRFNPVGRYHYPFRSRFSAGLALSHLKEVLAENLESQELLTLVQSGLATDLRVRILDRPIPDVIGKIGDEDGLSTAEAKALADKDHALKQELLGRCGAGSLLELGQRLAAEDAVFDQAAGTLAALIHQMVRRFSLQQSEKIAKDYLEVMRTLCGKPSAGPAAIPVAVAASPPPPVTPAGSAPACAA